MEQVGTRLSKQKIMKVEVVVEYVGERKCGKVEAEGRRDLRKVNHPKDHFQTNGFAVDHKLISDAAKKPETVQ